MIRIWLHKLFRRQSGLSRGTVRSRRPGGFRPQLEGLEERLAPAFLSPLSYTAGTAPAAIAVSDYNADGKSDMAVVNNAVAGTVGIMISNGDGTFQPMIDYAAGPYATDAKAGDFNSDGKIDLAVVGTTGTVNILLGNGDGSFAAPASYQTGVGSHALVVGDFNNDGKFDVATMNSGSASVLLGNGDGTFQAHQDAVFIGNTNMIAGDFNHDGNLDLATSNTFSVGTITVLYGHGDGTFNPEININANSAPVYLAAGDFNQDGFTDFAVANSYSATSMSVVLNNGDGTYAPPHLYPIAQTGYEIEVADFNNDGFQDFAVRGASQYQVEYGKGDGTFFPAQNFATPVAQFQKGSQHGDFNGDGAIDLAYVSYAGVTVVMNANDSAANLAGAVAFNITTPASTTSGSALPLTVTAVDAAGKPATGFLGTVFVTTNDPAVKSTFAYTFTSADAGTHSFTGSLQLVTLGDQTVTVASPMMTSSTTTVTVTPAVSRFAVSAPAATTAGDAFNVTVTAIDQLGGVGTGYTSTIHFSSSDVQAGLPADYTFTSADAGVHTFTVTLKSAGSKFLGASEVGGTVNGGSTVNVAPAAISNLALAGGSGAIGVARPITIVAHDVYGNVVPSYSGIVHITSSDAAAILPPDVALVNGVATVNVTLLTVGTQTITATDVVDATLTGTVSSDATPPVAALFTVAGYPATTAGVANSFTVTVQDTIGQTATSYTGTVYFTSSDMQAGLPASYTFTTADAGVHTFTATLRTAGTQSIAVRDLSGALFGSEMGISVNSAAFVGYRLSVPIPTDSHGHYLMMAGDLIPLTVKAQDVFGNAVSGYASTVHITSTDVQAGLPADYTFTATDAGVHTFTVVLKTTTANGVVWSFNVVDAANAATLATITNFEVVNAAASTFALTLPTQITAGAPFSSKLTVTDAYGNGVKNYFGTVHFSTSAALAGLPADYTFNSADAGVHDFTLSLNTSGNQTVSVADVNNPLIDASVSGTVKAAAVSAFAVAFPTTTTVGAAQPLTVTVVDAFGNASTGYNGTVAFSSSDVQAGLPASYTFTNKDAGVHTFSATLKTPGMQSITVKDVAVTTVAATVSGITVTALPAAALAVAGFPATTAGVAKSFTVTARDASGNVCSTYTGTVLFSSSDVKAGLPASYTFTAADAGVHTFSATLKTVGTQSITAKDAATASILGSETGIAVSAAVAVRFAISAPASVTQGVGFKFTVTAYDAYGNVATGYRGKVHLSSSDAKSGTQDYTFSNSDNGVHVFSYTFNALGLDTLTLTDTTDSSINGSGMVNVLAKK